MPKRSLRSNRKTSQKQKKRLPKRRRNAKSKSSSLGNLVATAATTLLSYIPGGTVFKPLADYAFKSFGWKTSSIHLSDPEQINAIVLKVAGVSCNVGLSLSSIVANSQFGAQATSSVDSVTRTTLISKFDEVKINSIRITILPTGQISSRQGMWCAVFLPIYDAEADTDLQGTNSKLRSIPSYNDIQILNGCVTKPATQRIVINYTPSTPYTKDYHRLKSYVGVLKIAYLDMERADAAPIEPSEFNSQVELNSSFVFRQSLMKDRYSTYDLAVRDLTDGVQNRFDFQGDIYHTTEEGLISHESSASFVPRYDYMVPPVVHHLLSKMTIQ